MVQVHGLVPIRRQAMTWTNGNLLSVTAKEHISMKFYLKLKHFHTRKCNWKCCLRNLSQFVQVSACYLNTLRPRQNGWHFADNIFMNENIWISINISLKFVRKGPIKNIPALVLIMACRRLGDKPLSELMIVLLIDAYKCVTRPQWVDAVFTSHLHQCFSCCHP